LIGPVARVSGSTSRAFTERLVTSEPLRGTTVPVHVATHVAGTLEFASGAVVSIAMSFDVAKHRHSPIELYGTQGSLMVPDPNRFGGTIEVAPSGQAWSEYPTQHPYADSNFRGLGVADMAYAIRTNRAHRASGELALHLLEVIEAFQTSSERGRHVAIRTRPERPHSLWSDCATGELHLNQ
jgi:predicted dehydrogenase